MLLRVMIHPKKYFLIFIAARLFLTVTQELLYPGTITRDILSRATNEKQIYVIRSFPTRSTQTSFDVTIEAG